MKESRQEINRQKNVLSAFKDGALIAEIKKATGFDINVRTLQRRLEDMIKQGLIKKTGQSHSTRYHLAEKKDTVISHVNRISTASIPLTDESRNILSIVSRPDEGL